MGAFLLLILVALAADQEYEVMLTGDGEDELYLSALYCEIVQIRYLCASAASARTCTRSATCATSRAIPRWSASSDHEMSVQAAIMSPEAYAYGATITPAYLK